MPTSTVLQIASHTILTQTCVSSCSTHDVEMLHWFPTKKCVEYLLITFKKAWDLIPQAVPAASLFSALIPEFTLQILHQVFSSQSFYSQIANIMVFW